MDKRVIERGNETAIMSDLRPRVMIRCLRSVVEDGAAAIGEENKELEEK
ncbi:hypothetical protein L195_g039574 [Trifolium pratense]|uniref:Uncharacterized protein n=1 Tax=Trifolium pratense TaxID=57577 RepID=A0A2K3LYB3_TRIPR|nr:hypothetical protein L195_g039574 [Trifolium pratense]